MTATTPDIPTAAGDPQYPAHGFDIELCLIFFDKDILHVRRFAKSVAAILENGQFLVSLRQLALETGNLCCLFTLSLRGSCLALLFATPVIELGFVQTEFTSSDTDAFCKLQGSVAKFRRMLLTWLLTG